MSKSTRQDASLTAEWIGNKQKCNERTTAYFNTELLLKQYKNIAWMLEFFPKSFDRLTIKEDREVKNNTIRIRKTHLLLDRLKEALTVLQKKPENGERLYELIYLTYITPESLTHNDLLYRLNLSSRHYYRLREQAITILSIQLWTSPDDDLAFWLNLISEQKTVGLNLIQVGEN